MKDLFWISKVVGLCALSCGSVLSAQTADFAAVWAEADFSKHVRGWDGFGVNYVEVAESVDYTQDPQEYRGFSLLTEEKRQQVVDMVFGDEGLKPGLIKMFLDPHHQAQPGGEFDHETTTRWMRYFVREGLKRTRGRGNDRQIITTLYGPPAWAAKQRFLRGRDLDPARKYDLARYMVDWVRYLREQEKLPIKYLSLHNEGEDWTRWPADGAGGNLGKDKRIAVKVLGGGSDTFEAYRTTDEKDRYQPLGIVKLEGDTLLYGAPAQSVTTFFAK